MKILQLNTWGGRLGSKIKEVINREQPDIVCFQEAIKVEGGSGFVFDELSEIQEDTGFEHCYFSASFGWKLMKREAQSGLATMSKLPFSHTDNAFTRLEYITDFDILDTDYNVRSLQHVTVDYDGKQVHVLNHHGHHVPNHKDGDEETMRQCQMIVDYLDKLDGQIVLCGDFNLKPDSKSLGLINAKLLNHAKERGVLTTRTPLTHKTEVCDYIFTSSDIEVKDFQVLDDIASDHKALTLEF
ncbi:hypothetical protein CL653_01005 [bacterium]|nr:hypothetical protein [bacterium]